MVPLHRIHCSGTQFGGFDVFEVKSLTHSVNLSNITNNPAPNFLLPPFYYDDSDSMYGSSITSTDDDYSVYEQNGGSGGFIPTVGKLRGGRGDSADTNLQHAPIGGINNYDLNRMNSSANRKGVPITLLGPELPCGGVGHGVCHMGKCVCSAGYTGPLCLAYVAQNDINYDAMAEAPLVVQTPQIMPSLALLVLVGGT
jgi:hypothetical protein